MGEEKRWCGTLLLKLGFLSIIFLVKEKEGAEARQQWLDTIGQSPSSPLTAICFKSNTLSKLCARVTPPSVFVAPILSSSVLRRRLRLSFKTPGTSISLSVSFCERIDLK